MRRPFTPTEMYCIKQAALGKSCKEIAAAKGKSLKTVENQMAKARRRIYAANTTHLVAECFRKGWLK